MTICARLVIVGTGLIGGSAALAARAAGVADRIIGVDANSASLVAGVEGGVIDASGLPDDLGPEDLVLIATPTRAVPAVLEDLSDGAGAFAGGATVTDTASVKGFVLAAAQALAGGLPARFVPGHPIAGSERSGIGAARADLFAERRVILTPAASTDPAALARVRDFWSRLGARVSSMDVMEHDRVLAMTSHLPHLLAFTLVDTLGREPEHAEIFALAAGGFRDFTRIASSDPTMWADIFSTNAEATLAILDRLGDDLQQVRALLAADDHAALHALFQRARSLRDAHVPGARKDE